MDKARKRLEAVIAYLRSVVNRFLNNNPRNEYEEIIFGAIKMVVLRMGRA